MPKAHKDPGSQEIRLIHQSSCNPYEAGMMYVNSIVGPFLNSHSHILKDVHSLCRLLERTPVGPNSTMRVIDIKEFYPTGTHEELADCVVKNSKGSGRGKGKGKASRGKGGSW